MEGILIFVANVIAFFGVAVTTVFIGCYSALLATCFALLYVIAVGMVSNELDNQ